MRRWGILVTAFYALLLFVLITLWYFDISKWENLDLDIWTNNADMFAWYLLGFLVFGQVLLLWLSVDTSWRRRHPTGHFRGVLLWAIIAAAVLTFALTMAVGELLFRVPFENDFPKWIFPLWLSLWLGWAILFFIFYKQSSNYVDTIIRRVLAGSILELLIAIPCHLYVRQRTECCASMSTGLGVVFGIAIMLMCFGPAVLALYKKRLESYGSRDHSSAIDIKSTPMD